LYSIDSIRLEPCKKSSFVKLERMSYLQDGIEKSWDIAQVHDSVAVLLYHVKKEAFVLVRQFRPPVYLKNRDGFTFELCAGIVDKDKTLKEIAKEEVYEECGYDIPLESIEKITSYYTSVGFAGARQTLYYAEADEDLKVHAGGGVDAEMIEIEYLPLSKAKKFLLDESKAKTPGLMFAFMWWFENK